VAPVAIVTDRATHVAWLPLRMQERILAGTNSSLISQTIPISINRASHPLEESWKVWSTWNALYDKYGEGGKGDGSDGKGPAQGRIARKAITTWTSTSPSSATL
jgi:hypothetical protein